MRRPAGDFEGLQAVTTRDTGTWTTTNLAQCAGLIPKPLARDEDPNELKVNEGKTVE